MKRMLLLITVLMPFSLAAEEGQGTGVSGSVHDLQREVQAAFESHDFQKVVKVYKDYVSAHPAEFMPLTSRVLYSQSLASTGDVTEAIEVLQTVLISLPPESRFVRLQYDLANLLVMEKRYPEAKKAFERVLFEVQQQKDLAVRAKERLNQIKDKDGRKKDVSSLRMIDIETALEAGQAPEGAEEVLKQIQSQNPSSPLAKQAEELLSRWKTIHAQKARSLLDEARRLFDVDRKYGDVRVLLDQIKREYPDFEEMQSVEALRLAVDQKEGKVSPR